MYDVAFKISICTLAVHLLLDWTHTVSIIVCKKQIQISFNFLALIKENNFHRSIRNLFNEVMHFRLLMSNLAFLAVDAKEVNDESYFLTKSHSIKKVNT